jgi:hypothetical protein
MVTPGLRPVENLHLVVLDQRVGQQALAHLRHLRGILHVELDQPADVDVRDAVEAERGERALDGLPLGVEDALLRADQDPCPQADRSSQASNGSPVMRS